VTFLCVNGMQHTWQQRRLLTMWVSADTSASSRATNAPMVREEVCPVGLACRLVPVNVPKAEMYATTEVAE